MSAQLIVFTDGACSGNPGPGGWGSIIAWSDGRVVELGGGERGTTNNRMEMTAAIEALAQVPSNYASEISLYTDSTYLIKGITQWIWGWRARGWKNAEGKDVANRDLWEDLAEQITRLEDTKINWKYVRGHAGIPGNERCDAIAVGFATGRTVELYSGPREHYPVDLSVSSAAVETVPAKQSGSASSRSTGSSAGSGPVTYLSYHSGVVMRHRNWGDCEKRVKGQSHAKFKKAKSQQEEREILSGWGLDPHSTVIQE